MTFEGVGETRSLADALSFSVVALMFARAMKFCERA
jgi:hypothetical protein